MYQHSDCTLASAQTYIDTHTDQCSNNCRGVASYSTYLPSCEALADDSGVLIDHHVLPGRGIARPA